MIIIVNIIECIIKPNDFVIPNEANKANKKVLKYH